MSNSLYKKKSLKKQKGWYILPIVVAIAPFTLSVVSGIITSVFAVRQVCEKYLANGKDVFRSFMNLEKAYDTIDRHGL